MQGRDGQVLEEAWAEALGRHSGGKEDIECSGKGGAKGKVDMGEKMEKMGSSTLNVKQRSSDFIL